MYTMNGAQLTVRLLERQSIGMIAGIPGGANLPLYDALLASPTIRHILCRHEQGAGFFAQGLARSTGLVGVCLATSGPGATNIMTAIADAYLDSIPFICITGQVPLSMIGTDAFQEVDTYGMSIPITKHNFLVRRPEELLEIIPRAFEMAQSGRPGPVLIDVPKDVQTAMVTVEQWPEPGGRLPLNDPEEQLLREAVEMIEKAQRPVLCLGGGIIHSGAAEEARLLAEKSSIPVTMTLMGLGSLPDDHPLSLGMLGMHAVRSTNYALQECDLFISAGGRFDDRATGKILEFCPDASVIHMDIDPSEVSKLRFAHVGLIGDVRRSLAGLHPRLRSRSRKSWHDRINQLKASYPVAGDEAERAVPARPAELLRTIAEQAGDRAIIATDVGKHQMWTAQAYPFRRPRQLLTSGGLGTMGFGLPAAIGASLACPGRPVVLVSGDGSIQMNIQELATAVEQRANVKIVIFNNLSLGLVRQQQNLFYDKNFYASDFNIDVDFATIARGFGMNAVRLESATMFRETFAEMVQKPGPCLIDIPVDRNEEVYPMVPPGASNSVMIGA